MLGRWDDLASPLKRYHDHRQRNEFINLPMSSKGKNCRHWLGRRKAALIHGPLSSQLCLLTAVLDLMYIWYRPSLGQSWWNNYPPSSRVFSHSGHSFHFSLPSNPYQRWMACKLCIPWQSTECTHRPAPQTTTSRLSKGSSWKVTLSAWKGQEFGWDQVSTGNLQTYGFFP